MSCIFASTCKNRCQKSLCKDKELSVAESVTTPSAEGAESDGSFDSGPQDASKDEVFDGVDEIDEFFDEGVD